MTKPYSEKQITMNATYWLCGLLLLVTSCKYQPNQVRSTLQSKNIYEFIEQGSIVFSRIEDRTKADLSFKMTGNYQCAISLWSEDPNAKHTVDQPKNYSCPKNENPINATLTGLEPSVPYSIKISVWPEKLSSQTSASITLLEDKTLREIQTDKILVASFNTARQTGEIYPFLLREKKSLLDIKNDILVIYDNSESCTTSKPPRNFIYSQNFSAPDPQSRALHGIESVSSDGYGNGKSKPHKFFSNRLVHNFRSINSNQPIEWQMRYDGQDKTFSTLQPVQLKKLNLTTERGFSEIINRSLKGAAPKIKVGRSSPRFAVEVLYPTEISYIHFWIQESTNREQGIFCTYKLSDNSINLDSKLYDSLGEGSYDFTAVVESIEIHFDEKLAYPPWIISHQDWVYSKFIKVL
ncbi:MAG: hypothetical protein HRU19_14925 [Pseudobacteriovorax sp.]|nr:hypothetical protein [Pseudobacteriovorax sp.]